MTQPAKRVATYEDVLRADFDLTRAFFGEAPQWICEVLSPSTQGKDRVRKLPIYAAHGVGHAWFVDPLSSTLEVFRREEGRWTLVGAYADAETVRAEPFEVLTIELADLWIDSPGGGA